MTAHTPGPWSHSADGRMPVRITADEDNRWKDAITKIADAGHALYGTGNFAETLANARLIAAAPDLLEALNVVRIWMKNHDRNPHEQKIYDAIRAAIAKAEPTS